MMRDLLNGLHPVGDLVPEGGDAPEHAETRRRAAIAVASRAKNAEDCAMLLDMLGLHKSDRRSEVA